MVILWGTPSPHTKRVLGSIPKWSIRPLFRGDEADADSHAELGEQDCQLIDKTFGCPSEPVPSYGWQSVNYTLNKQINTS